MAMAVAQEGRVKRQLGSIRQQKSQQHAVPRNGARAALGTRPQAARVCGTEIPNNKPLYISLTRIYGIGESRAWETLASCGVENKRVRDLSEDELARIRDHISGTYLVEGDLRRERNLAIKRLIEIQCLRGQRHQKNLPVRGQRTQTNARTRKGFKKTVSRSKKK